MTINTRRHHEFPVIFTAVAILFLSTPSPAQVTLVEDINPGEPGMGVTEFWTFEGTAHGSALYFAASSATAGTEFWVSQGTPETTGLVADIRSGVESSAPQDFVSTGSGVYFTAATSDDPYDRTLWRSIGTGIGTSSLGIPAQHPVVMGSSVYFQGWDATYGWQLWKASGDMTSRLSDIESANGGTPTDGLAVVDLTGVGERLFFFALYHTPELDLVYDLWMSDGTAAGTVEVKDIANGATAYVTDEIVGFDGRAFFRASDVDGNELWASDGTEAGTVQIKDINPSGSSDPNQLTVVGDQLLFAATSDGNYNHELWVTDGTTAGTYPLLVSEDFTVDNLTAYNGKLYFTLTTTGSGNELWTSDGTEAGTELFADLHTGVDGYGDPKSSSPKDLAVAGGLLFFSAADTDLHGRELWVTDGTTAHTLLVHDLKPGAYYGEVGPRGMTEVGDTLYFFANDGTIGHELYVLPTTDVIGQPTVSDGPGSGRTEEAYTYTASGGVSVRGNPTQLKFHWGDTTDSGWLTAGDNQAEKTWDEEADYDVWVEAKSDSGSSNASAALTVDIDFTEWVSAVGSGPTEGFIDNEYQYTITGESSYGHELEYAVDWGDGGSFDWDAASWTALDPETNEVALNHAWTGSGDYVVEPRVRCATHTDRWGRHEVWVSIADEELTQPTISGPGTGDVDTEYGFTFSGSSNAGHDLEYTLDWGDGTPVIDWTPFGEGVTSIELFHAWGFAATHTVSIGIRCIAHNSDSAWNDTTIEITAPPDEELTGPDLQHVGGDWNGYPDASVGFTLSASSNLGHDLQYRVTWDDGGDSGWVDFGAGVTSVPLSHIWTEQVTDVAEYFVDVWVRCKNDQELENWGQWSVWIIPEAVSDRSLTGPTSGVAGVSYDYTLTAHTHSGHAMEYKVWWGHGLEPSWQDLDHATGTAHLSHAWPVDGADHDYLVGFDVRCKAHPSASDWASITVSIPGETILNHTMGGPTDGLVGVDYDFSVGGTSSEGHGLEYKFDWGDGFPTDWQSLASGSATESYHWAFAGEFTVKASVRCGTDNQVLSEKTMVVTITEEAPPGLLFDDDFEAGDLSEWSAVAGAGP